MFVEIPESFKFSGMTIPGLEEQLRQRDAQIKEQAARIKELAADVPVRQNEAEALFSQSETEGEETAADEVSTEDSPTTGSEADITQSGEGGTEDSPATGPETDITESREGGDEQS